MRLLTGRHSCSPPRRRTHRTFSSSSGMMSDTQRWTSLAGLSKRPRWVVSQRWDCAIQISHNRAVLTNALMPNDGAERDQQQHGVHHRRDEWVSGEQRAYTLREWDDR